MAYLHRLFSGVTPVQPQLSAASLCPFWVTSGQSPAKPATPGDALVGCTVHIGSLKYAHHFGVDCFATLTEHSSTRFGSVSKEPWSGLRKPGLPSCVLHETRNALQPKSNRETFPKTKWVPFSFRETNKPMATTGRNATWRTILPFSGGLAGERRLMRELQTYGVRARAAHSGRSIQAVS